MIAHVDLDAFFTSVEQLLDPRLAGKPVVVGGPADARGVVASASYEARARGVYVPMPLTRAYRVCPEAHFLTGRHGEYSKFSKRVFEICRQQSPTFEAASIDEGYFDWKREQWTALHPVSTGRPASRAHPVSTAHPVRMGKSPGRHWPVELAERLRDAVLSQTGLNVSIGIAKNRLVAKIASKCCKPRGVCHIAEGFERAFLRPMPLSVVPGIGQRATAMLEATGLVTFDDVQRLSMSQLESRVGSKWAERLQRLADGEGSKSISLSGPPKSISSENTFATDCRDMHTVRAMLYRCVEKAAWRLRKAGLKAGTLTVKLRTADFKTVERSRSLGFRTDQHQELYGYAQNIWRKLSQGPLSVRLIGVRLSSLDESSNRQLLLHEKENRCNPRSMNQTVDQIRDRFGFEKLVTGGAL
ncbi:MAG: DNA polymerase IV [Planctomycetes bacterium]|nr:DNA polymerase IV [Planctomycetota bacterium]